AVATTPRSPLRIILASTICLFFVGAMALAWFGEIEIFAVASGRIQPVGRSKLVQPVEAGQVSELHVLDGDHVKGGDIVAELDPTEEMAEQDSVARHLGTL